MSYDFRTEYCPAMYNYRAQNLESLIKEAIKDEMHDTIKYRRMLAMAQNEKVKKQINFPYEDEQKHQKMFEQLYIQLLGKPANVEIPTVETYNNLLEAVESSIDGELEAVEFYKKILFALPNNKMKEMVYDIITDEQEHATRFVYVYSMLK